MPGPAMARMVIADVPWLGWVDQHDMPSSWFMYACTSMHKPTPVLVYICPQLLPNLQQWKSH